MNKKYMVFDQETNKYEYDIVIESSIKTSTMTLYYSNGSQWNEKLKGTKILSIVDNGNTIKLDREIKNLQYHEFTELRILLSFKHNINNCIERYTIIENNELMII